MRNTAPNFFKINPDGLTTLQMPVIPTIISYYFWIWTNAPFLLHIMVATAIRILFSRGGKFRGRKISRNSIRSGYYFRGRKISRKIQIREYSENFLHAKNWCYTVIDAQIKTLIGDTQTSNKVQLLSLQETWRITANTGCLSTYNSIFGCLNGVRRHCTGDRFSIEQVDFVLRNNVVGLRDDRILDFFAWFVAPISKILRASDARFVCLHS